MATSSILACPPDHPIRCTSWRKGSPVCVHKLQICNGHVLCKNGEDEHNCGRSLTFPKSDIVNPLELLACDSSASFTCPGGSGNDTICLPWSKYCDGVQDCPYASEETNCCKNPNVLPQIHPNLIPCLFSMQPAAPIYMPTRRSKRFKMHQSQAKMRWLSRLREWSG